MPNFLDLLVVIGMLFLRIGVPAVVIALIAYGLKRLDARWEREARAYTAQQAGLQPGVQPKQPRPAAPARKPVPAPAPLPFVPPAQIKDSRVQPGMMMAAPQPGLKAATQQACWDMKGCSDVAKSSCPAPQHPEQHCWEARFDAEGAIPEDCVGCDVFQRYPKM
jgi:hypothetical protein